MNIAKCYQKVSKTDHRRNSITELTLTNVYLYCYFVLLTPKNLCETVGIRGRGALVEKGANFNTVIIPRPTV